MGNTAAGQKKLGVTWWQGTFEESPLHSCVQRNDDPMWDAEDTQYTNAVIHCGQTQNIAIPESIAANIISFIKPYIRQLWWPREYLLSMNAQPSLPPIEPQIAHTTETQPIVSSNATVGVDKTNHRSIALKNKIQSKLASKLKRRNRTNSNNSDRSGSDIATKDNIDSKVNNTNSKPSLLLHAVSSGAVVRDNHKSGNLKRGITRLRLRKSKTVDDCVRQSKSLTIENCEDFAKLFSESFAFNLESISQQCQLSNPSQSDSNLIRRLSDKSFEWKFTFHECVIYDIGDMFAAHRDSPFSECDSNGKEIVYSHTLVLIPPNSFLGGDLILYPKKGNGKFVVIRRDLRQWRWALFHKSITHESTEVWKGIKIAFKFHAALMQLELELDYLDADLEADLAEFGFGDDLDHHNIHMEPLATAVPLSPNAGIMAPLPCEDETSPAPAASIKPVSTQAAISAMDTPHLNLNLSSTSSNRPPPPRHPAPQPVVRVSIEMDMDHTKISSQQLVDIEKSHSPSVSPSPSQSSSAPAAAPEAAPVSQQSIPDDNNGNDNDNMVGTFVDVESPGSWVEIEQDDDGLIRQMIDQSDDDDDEDSIHLP